MPTGIRRFMQTGSTGSWSKATSSITPPGPKTTALMAMLAGGQPPSMFSHNFYFNYYNTDLTMRDNIIMRGASFGAQVRSGGYIEDNVFLDNNIGVNFVGGGDDRSGEVGSGSYTLFRSTTSSPRPRIAMPR